MTWFVGSVAIAVLWACVWLVLVISRDLARGLPPLPRWDDEDFWSPRP